MSKKHPHIKTLRAHNKWRRGDDRPMVGDLAMLVARLARKLRKAAPADGLPAQALDYLNRNGLKGSPLRKVGAGETAVTREMTNAAIDVMLKKGDVILSADFVARLYMAMDAVRHNAEFRGDEKRSFSASPGTPG